MEIENIKKWFTDYETALLKTNTVESKVSGTLLTIQQTQRNGIKRSFVPILAEIIKNFVPDTVCVDLTGDGVAISINNDSLEQPFVILINPSIANLDYDAENEAHEYEINLKKKEEKEKQKKEKVAKAQIERKKPPMRKKEEKDE